MGAPDSGMKAAEQPTADTLLSAFRTIKDAERARHASVLNYWLSIRGNKEFPPLHDLDPLEISDAAPCSILLELISGGQDAEIRHLGDALTEYVTVQRVIDAPNPSILSCLARKLPIVAISRDFLAFEESFDSPGGWTQVWVTLLPLSSCGSWVDYVYAVVSVEKSSAKIAKPAEAAPEPDSPPEATEPEAAAVDPVEEVPAEPVCETAVVDEPPVAADPQVASVEEDQQEAVSKESVEPMEAVAEDLAAGDEEAATGPEAEPVKGAAEEQVEAVEATAEDEAEPVEVVTSEENEPAETVAEEEVEPVEAVADDPVADNDEALAEELPAKGTPGFSKLLEGIASLTGFYGQGIKVDEPLVQYEPLPGDALPAAEAFEPVSAEADVEQPLELDEPAPVTETVASEPVDGHSAEELPVTTDQPAPAMEGTLQNQLTEVRAKADEANQARLRAVAAMQEGLSAAYDFALDAESCPEEYLRLVEAQGLKIQLRAPMAPVARLAFGDACDDATIKQFEKLLAWALKEELPRGELLERINAAGGIEELLGEVSKAS